MHRHLCVAFIVQIRVLRYYTVLINKVIFLFFEVQVDLLF